MTDPVPAPCQGQGRYQSGVWLSKAEGSRSEKYQKWTEEHAKSTVKHLDEQKHSSLVKLNCECLEVRTELRGLRQDRRFLQHPQHPGFNRRQRSQGLPGKDIGVGNYLTIHGIAPSSHGMTLRSTPATESTASSGVRRSKRMSPPSGWTSFVPGSCGSSLSSSSAVLEGPKIRAAVLNPGVSAMKLKNLHSSRSLSKLNNNMDITY